MTTFGFGKSLLASAPAQVPNSALIGLLGHSQVAGATGAFASPRAATYMGPQHTFGWASLTSGGRYVLDEYGCAGVSGSTSTDILTTAVAAFGGKTQLEAVKGSRAGTFILNTGVNDTKTIASLNSTTIPNFRTIIRTLLGRGKQVVVMTPSAKGHASFASQRTTGEVSQFLFGLRSWILNEMTREFPRNVYAFDAFAATAELASVNGYGDVKTGYTYDGLHFNSYGNLMLDRAMVEALAPVLGGVPAPNLGLDAAYSFDAANAPRGNLLTNGIMRASTSAVGTSGGVTFAGVKPGNWFFEPNSILQGNATLTATGAFETGTPTGDWFKITFAGTINAAQDYAAFDLAGYIGATNFASGDVLRQAGEVEIVAGAVGITHVSCGFALTGGGGASMTQGFQQPLFDKSGIDAAIATQPLTLTYPGGLSVPVVGSTPTGARAAFAVHFGANPSGVFTVNGAVRFRNARLWKGLA
ncbi:MAG: SGNH/GDSL hydrolase family protein [Proteobacteria bacterium]|nr:SGNH/GDSL hydrolase family protein [Pseudomonadota bacterium]